MRRVHRRRRRGPEPKPREERRSILVGVKVSPAELGAIRSAARSLPVATWMRSRALEALEVESQRERAESLLRQAKSFRDRAVEVLGEMDRKLGARIAAVDRLIARATRAEALRAKRRGPHDSKRRRGSQRRHGAPARRRRGGRHRRN